ncbi:MAG: hypothetical protein JRI45_08205 [Deltaproteobacteria bacterium]|nr:hypothetical protein [Deltaproteobacteria bacterium]
MAIESDEEINDLLKDLEKVYEEESTQAEDDTQEVTEKKDSLMICRKARK